MARSIGFTNLQARLASPGAIQWDTSGEMTLTDIYYVKLPGPRDLNGSGNPVSPAGDDSLKKWRPLGWNVYQPATGGGTTPVLVAAKNVNGIPERNSGHPNYPFMRAVSIRWTQPDNTSNIWTCEVQYKYSPAEKETEGNPDPEEPAQTTKFIEAEFYSHNITLPMSAGSNGVALTTTAGEPITPEPTIDVASPCLRITARNKISPDRYTGYMGSLNATGIRICGIYFPKYCARLTYGSRVTEITVGGTVAEPQTEEVYEHVFNIEGNFSPAPAGNSALETLGGVTYGGWARLIPNAGYSYIDSSNHLTRAQIISESDPTIYVDSPMPVALDSSGHRKSTPGFDYFTILPAAATNWANLGFPTTW